MLIHKPNLETTFSKSSQDNCFSMTAPKLPNWTYQVKQIAESIYALHGVDQQGNIVDSVGTDLGELEEDFFEAAQKIDLDQSLT